MSPTNLPSSQASIPDRDVFWDMDTPESRRTREKIAAEMKNISGSPRTEPSATVNQLRLFAPQNRRSSKSTDGEGDHHGHEVLQDLVKLNAEMKESKENQKPSELAELPAQSKSPGEETSTTNDLFPEDDMFGDSDPFGTETDSIQNEFDEDDNDFLLAASQAVEQDYKSSTPAQSVNTRTQPQPSCSERQTSKMKIQRPEVVNYKAFDNINDSYDDLLSQVETPMGEKESSPILKKPTKTPVNNINLKSSLSVPKPSPSLSKMKTRVASCKAFDNININDSFDDLLSQMEMPVAEVAQQKLPVISTKVRGAQINQNPAPAHSTHPPVTSESKGGLIRKYSSFGSPSNEKKIFGKKFRSDSQIEMKKCTKEEIERKKKLAMERRKVSSSQKRRL